AVGLVVTSRVLKVPLLSLGDLASVSTPIGLGLVRVANFINGELWGSATDLPWGVVFEAAGPLPRHPSQLYEAFLEGAVLLAVLYALARRKPPLPQGSYFGVYLIGYGVFRIAVEFIRQPDAQIGYLLGTTWLTMGMLLTLPMVLGGIVMLYVALKRNEPQRGQLVQED
ncbi:MAG: prolipoprotein diacylglyceryl transferase, partial [Coriobacteriia bacterium]|nr:prolipoprotein diacylglyceryl transferase [Coriobacteriia bacterium]